MPFHSLKYSQVLVYPTFFSVSKGGNCKVKQDVNATMLHLKKYESCRSQEHLTATLNKMVANVILRLYLFLQCDQENMLNFFKLVIISAYFRHNAIFISLKLHLFIKP